jgi:branched-chain amino acid aminotransferase
VFLDGKFVSEEQAMVSVFDRSFLYGDGLFETLLVSNGRPFRWAQHWERLQRGAAFLGMRVPFSSEVLLGFAMDLISRNQLPDSLLRLTLSRGVGPRGYSPKGADRPTLVMSLHAAPWQAGSSRREEAPSSKAKRQDIAPPGGQEAAVSSVPVPIWKLISSSVRLSAGEPVAQFKTCNKLPQILARAEADTAGADEALLLNTDGFVVEAASSNLFWIEDGAICSPPLASGILPGVTRAVVLELCDSLGLTTREGNITRDALQSTDAVFLSLSSWGVVQAGSLDGLALKRSPEVETIRRAYWDLVLR